MATAAERSNPTNKNAKPINHIIVLLDPVENKCVSSLGSQMRFIYINIDPSTIARFFFLLSVFIMFFGLVPLMYGVQSNPLLWGSITLFWTRPMANNNGHA